MGTLFDYVPMLLGAVLYGFFQKYVLKKEKLAIAFVPFMLVGYIVSLFI